MKNTPKKLALRLETVAHLALSRVHGGGATSTSNTGDGAPTSASLVMQLCTASNNCPKPHAQ